MCEWNVKVNPSDPDERDLNNNILYAVGRRVLLPVRYVLWKVRVWTHGPDCRWGNLVTQLVGGRDA